MKWKVMGVAALTAALFAGAVYGAGFTTNGLTAVTPPLTGDETVAADTNLPNGLNPASEAITTGELGFAFEGQYNAATNTADFTATAAQVSGYKLNVLALTGNITAGKAVTLPTYALLTANLPGAFVGQSFVVRVINRDGSDTWTVTAGSGGTVSGTATVAHDTWRDFLVTIDSTTAYTFTNIGGGSVT